MSETALNGQISPEELKARREARRRKILENAVGRLEKLNGRLTHENQNGEVKEVKEIYPNPEIENLEDVPFQQNYLGFNDRDFINFGATNSTDQENIFELLNNLSSTGCFNEPSAKKQPPKSILLSKILKTKVHLALLSLLTYVLFCTGHEFWVSYSVFFPLLLWELIEYFLLKRYQTKTTSIFEMVLWMSGLPEAHSSALLKVLGTLNNIFKNVGVFLFFFVLYHIFATKVLLRGGSQLLQPVYTNREEM